MQVEAWSSRVVRQSRDQSLRKLARRQSIRTTMGLGSYSPLFLSPLLLKARSPGVLPLLDSWSHPLSRLSAWVVQELQEEAVVGGCLSWGQRCHNSFPSFRPMPLPSHQMLQLDSCPQESGGLNCVLLLPVHLMGQRMMEHGILLGVGWEGLHSR